MRTDSCRTCGVEMKEFQRCTACREVNRFVCFRCKKATDEQIHINCDVSPREVILN